MQPALGAGMDHLAQMQFARALVGIGKIPRGDKGIIALLVDEPPLLCNGLTIVAQ